MLVAIGVVAVVCLVCLLWIRHEIKIAPVHNDWKSSMEAWRDEDDDSILGGTK